MKRVGIIGGGQLARMLALAGHPLGVRCRVLDPAEHPPAADLAEHVRGDYDDPEALDRFVEGLDVVTYELENVPASTSARLAERAPMRPSSRALAITQDRLAEKEFLRDLGLATTDFYAATSMRELRDAARIIGLPMVVKTRRQGYDGRGQAVVRAEDEIPDVWRRLGGHSLIVEAFVPFDRELSVIAARSTSGQISAYPIVENFHRDGILLWTLAPAPRHDAALQCEAERISALVMDALDYVGVSTAELFQCGDRLLVNEIAPRVHNSGHWTIEGAATSQFENHLRAIVAWPLGSTAAIGASALVNLLGEVPPLDRILTLPDTHVHLYNKSPQPRRKIGHITARAPNPDEAARRLATMMSIA